MHILAENCKHNFAQVSKCKAGTYNQQQWTISLLFSAAQKMQRSVVVQKKPQFPSRKIKLHCNHSTRERTCRFSSRNAFSVHIAPFPNKCNYHTKINMHAPQKHLNCRLQERTSNAKLNISHTSVEWREKMKTSLKFNLNKFFLQNLLCVF